MLDFLLRVSKQNKDNFTFVFFNTGIEYEATHRHLDFIEKKYNISIDRVWASEPVASGVRKLGYPFISKFISQMIDRLQRGGFDFKEDGNKGFEELCEKFPKSRGALTWWCNTYKVADGKSNSQFNISNTKYLKEFLMENPPTFKISAKCCVGAKKDPSKKYMKGKSFDMKCLGLRKAEGGIRSVSIKSCFNEETNTYLPIFWFTDKMKLFYKRLFNVEYSDCYEVYGMKRTGCIGCPFNSKFQEELETLKKHEPKLYVGAKAIFKLPHEYTLAYRKFKNDMKEKKNQIKGQHDWLYLVKGE